MLRGKVIALNICIRKQTFRIKNSSFHFNKLEKDAHIKSKVNSRKEAIKIRSERMKWNIDNWKI